jgi:hypothetical protein
MNKRNIKIDELFNYELTKEKYQKIREIYIKKYFDILNSKKEEFN